MGGREQQGQETDVTNWPDLVRLAFDHGDAKVAEAREAHAADLRAFNQILGRLLDDVRLIP